VVGTDGLGVAVPTPEVTCAVGRIGSGLASLGDARVTVGVTLIVAPSVAAITVDGGSVGRGALGRAQPAYATSEKNQSRPSERITFELDIINSC